MAVNRFRHKCEYKFNEICNIHSLIWRRYDQIFKTNCNLYLKKRRICNNIACNLSYVSPK
jgi:hypothetical protein